jgi:hypothetical protein
MKVYPSLAAGYGFHLHLYVIDLLEEGVTTLGNRGLTLGEYIDPFENTFTIRLDDRDADGDMQDFTDSFLYLVIVVGTDSIISKDYTDGFEGVFFFILCKEGARYDTGLITAFIKVVL